ncbi:hypothetical protein [Rhizobium paknamense]|uniref:Membrane glycosyltransferase n=1 Tax=Rhizobium paknamense TaxID=1206817 RepID=A0ABU0I8Y6_9HYPH|nr:hypothetical protein [Rhizobium paknamense]MDQ0454698.1 membrane glycosyltransferase [Rhizobium paknamense]
MKISIRRKVAMTAVLASIYLAVCTGASWIAGHALLNAVVAALLAVPFAWLIRETWSDD